MVLPCSLPEEEFAQYIVKTEGDNISIPYFKYFSTSIQSLNGVESYHLSH